MISKDKVYDRYTLTLSYITRIEDVFQVALSDEMRDSNEEENKV